MGEKVGEGLMYVICTVRAKRRGEARNPFVGRTGNPFPMEFILFFF